MTGERAGPALAIEPARINQIQMKPICPLKILTGWASKAGRSPRRYETAN
jgi:hypothetical protein